MKINLVMIVKNEERFFGTMPGAGERLVDEIVIADTAQRTVQWKLPENMEQKCGNMSGKTILRQPGILPSGIRTRSGI